MEELWCLLFSLLAWSVASYLGGWYVSLASKQGRESTSLGQVHPVSQCQTKHSSSVQQVYQESGIPPRVKAERLSLLIRVQSPSGHPQAKSLFPVESAFRSLRSNPGNRCPQDPQVRGGPTAKHSWRETNHAAQLCDLREEQFLSPSRASEATGLF